MYGILIYVDLTLAVLTLIAAPVAGFKASRRWLYPLAGLAAGRLIVALLLLTGGLLLADSRLSVQVPLALLPAAWAAWRPGRTAAHLAAAGGVLSVWWLLAPFAPQDTVLVLAGSAAALGVVFWLSHATRRSWAPAALLLVPASPTARSPCSPPWRTPRSATFSGPGPICCAAGRPSPGTAMAPARC